MGNHAPPPELLGFLRPYDRSVRELALAIREVVLDELAPCCENIYDAYNAVAIGYGPTDRLKHGIVHIAVYTAHVNLGFNRGAEMADPERILQGTGKNVRHIRLRTREDVNQPAVRIYLRQAKELSERAGVAGPERGVQSGVKAIYERRRRPPGSKNV